MSESKKKPKLKVTGAFTYPNVHDFISKEIGKNIVVSVKTLKERKTSGPFKALVAKVEQTKLKSTECGSICKIGKFIPAHSILYDMASALPTVSISKKLLLAIFKRISCDGLEKKYSLVFQKLVKEVREEYIAIAHADDVICIINPPNPSIKGHEILPPYKNLGRTLFHETYRGIIQRFNIRLIPTFWLMRHIYRICVAHLPQCLLSIKGYRSQSYTLVELYAIFDEEISKTKVVVDTWYQLVLEAVQKNKKKFLNYLKCNVYKCGSTLMATFLTCAILNTVEHIFEVTENEREIPYITMSMQYNKRIVLQPSLLECSCLYINLLRKLSTIAVDLKSLEGHYFQEYENKMIPVFLPPALLTYYERRIKYNIAALYSPVTVYIRALNAEFESVHLQQKFWKMESDLIQKVSDSQTAIEKEMVYLVGSSQTVVKSITVIEEDKSDYDFPKLIRESPIRSSSIKSLSKPLDKVTSADLVESMDLESYLQNLEEERNDLVIVKADISFEEGYAMVEAYRSYLGKISAMLDIEQYLVGELDQSSCKEAISEALNDMIQKVAKRLVSHHTWMNEDICEKFQMVKIRSQVIPQTSEELMELGAYMAWAASDHLTELREQIQLSINVMIYLIEMTTLTKQHMELNRDTIWWLKDIKIVFDENATMFEGVRTNFDKRLQQAIRKLFADTDKFIPLIGEIDLMDDADNSRTYIQQLANLMATIRDLDSLLAWINKEETIFQYQLTDSGELNNIKVFLYPFYRLVKVCFLLVRNTEAWLYGPFEYLEHSKSEKILEDLLKELTKMQKAFKNKIKQGTTDNSKFQFTGVLDDTNPILYPAPVKLCAKGIQMIRHFRPALHMMHIMCNDAMLQRHWDEMSEIAGFDLTPDGGTTLNKLMKIGIMADIEKYEIISVSATKERQLVQNLLKMQAEWESVYFKIGSYKETGIRILTALDDVQTILDEHIMKTLTMRGSIFAKPYASQVKAWYEKIVRANDTIEEWGKVQSQWLYLLPIFSSQDIVQQMPEEGVLFREVNGMMQRYVVVIRGQPLIIESAPQPGLLENLKLCLEMLEKINDGVAAYLEKKRLYFPRFFFLSNDEMLEILSETKNPLRVQPHLRKCFEGIDRLYFSDDLKIHAMFSEETERIEFIKIIDTVAARGSVEKWLVEVETQMLAAILNQLELSWEAYQKIVRADWVTQWPGQVILAISQVFWTINMHKVLNSIRRNDFVDFLVDLKHSLSDIVNLVRSPTVTNLTRITIKALIVIDVHAKDVTEDLYKKKVKSDSEFKWLAQLRYYWEERCIVRIINATVKYANEYLGNSDRLVITPLTDRCYRTLVGAYHLHLNGAPEGPAGTGKTETTKDLAKALAVQCVVFNCSDGLDYKAMGKFFKGLASSGAWSCFDEFNRIDVEVLSVVAQQILSIILAVRANVEKFVFEGTELKLNPACYVCITMNPGYAGRSELPDNLKVLFRTVAMMVPDYAMIGEISLYSYGFKDARILSVKIVTTYKCCSEQLSSQNHYDYGMRAVKSVLSACGNNKRKYPDEDEDILLLRSILDVNLPKFLNYDVPLFEGIISDLFPGISLPPVDYSAFITGIHASCLERNLRVKHCFITKIIQTYEMMIVRHGFMLVGEPFAGKTSTLKVLSDSLGIMHERGQNQLPVLYQFINPKSVTMGQLYGQFDPISYEWFDGVVATCFRNFVMDPRPDRKWVIFDGPVDAVWIENMNTVLDDNKKLCLMSGEVMAMTNVMSMIFEVMDLSQASPATVSRCGMIYMEPATLGWRPHVESWLPFCSYDWREGKEDYIMGIFDWVVPPSLYFIRKFCRQLCNSGEINLVKNMMQIVEMLLTEAFEQSSKDEGSKHVHGWIQAAFMTAMVWGLGSILDQGSREKFDVFIRTLWKGEDDDNPYPETMDRLDINLPEGGIIFDFSYVMKGKGSWKYWSDYVRTMRVEETRNIQQVLIPTVDTVKYMNMVEMHIRHNHSILLVGPTGTGKSFYLQDLLMHKLDQEIYEPAFVTFTVQISANQTQDLIISKMQKRKRGNYGPTKGKKSVIFVDDLNMPVKEVYGAQPPIELLRQFFDHKNWYDLKDTSPIYLHDILFIAAMGPHGGSRQEVYQRFLRHFSIFSINEFSNDTMYKIYSNVLLLGWKNNGFHSDAIQTVNHIVNATLDVYKDASITLLPTPAKSHYVFNLRDFSRIICGCAMLRKESVDDRSVFPKLWVHEVLRVMYDRLVDSADKEWLYQKLRNNVKNIFREDFDHVFGHLVGEDEDVTEESLHKLMFGTYLDTEGAEDELRYEEVTHLQAFINVATAAMEDYNSSNKNKMDIVLFIYALHHLSKICRILSIPSGSALLVGVSGSGRQSLTKIATTMAGHSFFQPEITNKYGIPEWREDLKKLMKEAGGKGKHTVFLFTEGQIKEERFLQDIDGLLNAGEVPNIFPIDEKQEILEMVRLSAQGGNRNLDISPLSIFSFFIKRTREKLHMILCFSPIGSSFRTRLRLYPSLVNCCTIDWFEDWPEDALERVAHSWMGDVNLTNEIKESVIVACKHFHVSARKISTGFFKETNRKTYITSASYLGLIKAFTDLTNNKQQELMKNKRRYVVGLDKLQFASEQIAQMQKDLENFQPQLKSMAIQAINMMRQIEEETAQVERASSLVKKDEEVANAQAAEAQDLKTQCEADLALAIPILQEAINALDTLKPADITLVKAMKNPPVTVKMTLAAVCVLYDIPPSRIPDPSTGRMILDYWGPSKKVLGDMNFLQSLKDFDKDHIKPELIAKIRKEYLTHKDFKPHIVAKASSAAKGLCQWVIAIDMYDKVNKVVAPKKAKLAEAERMYATTMAILMEKKTQVAILEQRLAYLNENLEEATEKRVKLQQHVDLCGEKLVRAHQLIGGLGGERSRWIAAANSLQSQYDTVAGDILLSCGMISYLSPFTMHWRVNAISEWFAFIKTLSIPVTSDYDFSAILGSEIKIQDWYIAGLPRDAFSTGNAIIQDNSSRWSLLIDPQSQANIWIKNMEKKNELHVTKFSEKNYMKIIESCIEFGKPALIESIGEDLEAPLDPILFKSIFKQSGVTVIGFGDNVIPYHKNFKLYLTSKLRNPHYLPEVFNKVTIINFALTLAGLEDQLLGIVVAKERPDLQRRREELIVEGAENKTALANVEQRILVTLSESKGDILEDEKAIQILNLSKVISIDIITKQIAAKETEGKIELFRLDFKPVSTHSAGLYYCIADLPNVDPMYQYSLAWFINLYVNSIDTAGKSRELEKRINFLQTNFTYNLYANVCRSLFEKDKLMFSFLLTVKIMMSQNSVKESEYNFLLTGGVDVENPILNPASNWLSSKSWKEICRIDKIKGFGGFRTSFTNNVSAWKQLYDSAEPQNERFPDQWNGVTSFQRLLIIRVLRPDKMNASVSDYVTKEMGTKFTVPPPFDIEKSFYDSNCLSPLIFILSPGTDPMSALQNFAIAKGYHDKLKCISLGQGQGPIAQALIEEGVEDGSWICLQNCHLATSWMTPLEQLWESIDVNNTHINFRMWLTSYPSDNFPVALLQYGVKMTNEPPTGLQQNLLRSYANDTVRNKMFYSGCPGKDLMFARLLYGIAFFHAVIQERRNFGPLGWNIPYGFNESDFDISVQQLQMFINEYADNPYEGVCYLTGECNYGGRVTDDWDRRLIVTLLSDYLNSNVVNDLNYSFSDVGKYYNIPRKSEYEEFIEHIMSLPQFYPPEVYGLHSNAGITRDLQVSQLLLNSLILVQGEASSSNGDEEALLSIITNDILSKLPKDFDLEKAQHKYPVMYNESMNTVLVQEMERFNKLLSEIRNSLLTILKAIKGLVVLTPALESLQQSLLLSRIPAGWAKVSYPSLKSLPNYVADFIERIEFLNKWFLEGNPVTYWLSGFFFTQAFLTGAKQNFARKYKIPIDQLTFDYKILKVHSTSHTPDDGIYVYGLYTDGAKWNLKNSVLEELLPKILHDYMPLIWLIPILVSNYNEEGRYLCPLYKTSERRGILSTTGHSTNYVLPFLLNTNLPPSHWVKRSVALLCQPD